MFKEITSFKALFPVYGVSFYLVEESTFLISSLNYLRVLSSAVLGGERRRARHIMNHTVDGNYSGDNPAQELALLADKLNLGKDVLGLMTAVDVRHTVMRSGIKQGPAVGAICTTGIRNACSAGRPPGEYPESINSPGTINIVVLIDGNLTDSAMVNAVITATEAKALAVFQAGIRLPDGSIATGTTTDAIVIACTGSGEPIHYAGHATALGSLIGCTVYSAVAQGINDCFAAVCRDK